MTEANRRYRLNRWKSKGLISKTLGRCTEASTTFAKQGSLSTRADPAFGSACNMHPNPFFSICLKLQHIITRYPSLLNTLPLRFRFYIIKTRCDAKSINNRQANRFVLIVFRIISKLKSVFGLKLMVV